MLARTCCPKAPARPHAYLRAGRRRARLRRHGRVLLAAAHGILCPLLQLSVKSLDLRIQVRLHVPMNVHVLVLMAGQQVNARAHTHM